MQMTMAEKRDFLERIRDLTLHDVLNREDRDTIFRVCMAACEREMVNLKEGQ